MVGTGTGNGLYAKSGTGATGDGAQFVAASTNGNGLTLTGAGTGKDFNATTTAIGAAIVNSGSIDSYTLQQSQRLILSALVGKLSGGGTTTIVIRDSADTKNRISATVDANNNRTAVTLDAT